MTDEDGVGVDEELAAFCEVEHRRLVGLLTVYVGERGTAEELAQDAMIRLCQHWPRVRHMAQPHAWVTRVALNLAGSWFRRRAAGRRALTRHGLADEVDQREDAAILAVRDAVAGLTPRVRQAVVLRFYAQYSVREAAQAMDCAEGTVKSLTACGVAQLREAGLHDDPELEEATR